MFQRIDIMGYTVRMYGFWNTVSAVMMVVYLIAQTKQFSKISPYAVNQPSEKRKMLVAFCEVFTIIVVVFALFGILNPAFGDWFTHGNANYYGALTAWIVATMVLSVIFKTSPLQMHDLFAPALPIQLFFAKLACFFHGCCSGIAMPDSWYFNKYSDRYEFPIQLTEALVALALYVFLRWYQKRSKISGILFPAYLFLYSTSRFLTEFLRDDFPNVLGPFDAYQVMSVVYVFFGAVLLYLVWRHHHKVSCRTEESDQADTCEHCQS